MLICLCFVTIILFCLFPMWLLRCFRWTHISGTIIKGGVYGCYCQIKHPLSHVYDLSTCFQIDHLRGYL